MILNIRGTNGTGKSTLARQYMGTEQVVLATQPIFSPTKKDPERWVDKQIVASVNPADSTVLLGRYTNNCGGCDEFSWKGSHDAMCEGILKAAGEYRHVVYEGMIISFIYGRYVELAKRIFQETGQSTHWIMLDIELEECLRRIFNRTGRAVDERMRNNVGSKHAVVQSLTPKLLENGDAIRIGLGESEKAYEVPLSVSVHHDNESAAKMARELLS
jgi:hypothetical protein